ncbi:hypothetical protein JL720_9694 [Aureococcus anophagefferens]|nr:hypothetical protein JL720_9694 [Aureococcus anophagefferens]
MREMLAALLAGGVAGVVAKRPTVSPTVAPVSLPRASGSSSSGRPRSTAAAGSARRTSGSSTPATGGARSTVLDTLDDYRGDDCKLTLRLAWPGATHALSGDLAWRQLSNPVRAERCAAVEGYEALDVAFTPMTTGNCRWGGLQSPCKIADTDRALLDGCIGDTPWWFSVGVLSPGYQGGMPAVFADEGDFVADVVELYAYREDASSCPTREPTTAPTRAPSLAVATPGECLEGFVDIDFSIGGISQNNLGGVAGDCKKAGMKGKPACSAPGQVLRFTSVATYPVRQGDALRRRDAGHSVRFLATGAGDGCDNPSGPMELGTVSCEACDSHGACPVDQEDRTVTLGLEHRSSRAHARRRQRGKQGQLGSPLLLRGRLEHDPGLPDDGADGEPRADGQSDERAYGEQIADCCAHGVAHDGADRQSDERAHGVAHDVADRQSDERAHRHGVAHGIADDRADCQSDGVAHGVAHDGAPTMSPTGTVSPTASPTLAPTASFAPTITGHTKSPTGSPTLAPTAAPTAADGRSHECSYGHFCQSDGHADG